MSWIGRIIFIFMALSVTQSLACDKSIAQFKRDCIIQDNFRYLKAQFKKKNIDINQIAEYKALRFISRTDWNLAQKNNVPVEQIYQPAPLTWRTWSSGINKVLNESEYKIENIRIPEIEKIHYDVYFDSDVDVLSEKFLANKNIRNPVFNRGVGYCVPYSIDKNFEESMFASQKLLSEISQDLKLLVRKVLIEGERPIISSEEFSLYSDALSVDTSEKIQNTCLNRNNKPNADQFNYSWMRYTEEKYVEGYLGLWIQFVKKVKKSFINKKPLMSPIAFAALAQKWFVMIHPFQDGNGRASRALQDIILKEFDLPFAPAGDLQADATTLVESYVENNYRAIENMLLTLKGCLSPKQSQSESCKVLTD